MLLTFACSFFEIRICPIVKVAAVPLFGKMAGAVGNYNAHLSSYPDVDWQAVGQSFVKSLNLQWNPYVTQVHIDV